MMTKRENWPELMHGYLTRVHHHPFIWGTLDCCMLAANTVHAMTGVDFLSNQRGRYTNAPGAYRVLKEDFEGSVKVLVNAAAIEHGWDEVDVLKAQRGDVILLPSQGDERFDGALGMCTGLISLALSEDRGLVGLSTIPTPGGEPHMVIQRAWRIHTKGG